MIVLKRLLYFQNKPIRGSRCMTLPCQRGLTRATADVDDRDTKHSIGIIGGGISGVAAAETLISGALRSGKTPEVQVFDRGRVVGGRCSSRHVDADGHRIEFDYGCQIICPRTEEFRQHVGQVWLKELGVVRECPRDQVVRLDSFGRHQDTSSNSHVVGNFVGYGAGGDVYVGFPNMNAVVSGVAQQCHRYPGFSVTENTAVTDIGWVGTGTDHTGPWRVIYGGGECKYFTHLLVADSAAVDLVQHHDIPAAVRDGLQAIASVEYEPVFAFVAAIQGSSSLAHFKNAILDHHNTTETTPLTPFSMISRQQQLQSHNTWVALTSQQKAREILERWPMRTATGTVIPQDRDYRKEVAEYLEPDFKQALQYLGEEEKGGLLKWTFSHRWGRAFPTSGSVLSTPSIHIQEYGIGACGDAFHFPTASPSESAWLSGRHLANQILKQIL